KSSFRPVGNLEVISGRFLPFAPITVCLEQFLDFHTSHRGIVPFLKRLDPADPVVERDDDDKILVRVRFRPARSVCWSAVTLFYLRFRFADSRKCGRGT